MSRTVTLRCLLAIAVLGSAAAAGSEPECPSALGLDELLGRGRVLLLGEIHGTEEAPRFVETVACQALARGLEVTIALELPHAEENAVRDPDVRVVALPFWTKDYQDGRTSRAMLRLIERARAWSREGQDVEMILLDEPSDFRQRDQRMAERLLAAVTESPDRFFVALTGNLHSRTAPGTGRMGERVVGELGRDRVSSLDMEHAGGSAWICEVTQGCGPLELRAHDGGPAGQIRLFATPDSRGIDGTYSVGPVSVSPPARAE